MTYKQKYHVISVSIILSIFALCFAVATYQEWRSGYEENSSGNMFNGVHDAGG